MKKVNFYASVVGWAIMAGLFFTTLFEIAGQDYGTLEAIIVGVAVPMIVGPLYVDD